jgi:hypothetical protein
MYLTPFSTPVEYSAPDGKGIYTTHEPKELPAKPPAPGAVVTRALIGTDGEVYSTPYQQLAGNISWWGPLYDPAKPDKGRRVLSYAGPKLRYFLQPDFNYGDVLTHNEVYYHGGCVGIAPGPVLGACLRLMDYYDPIERTTTELWHLLVISYSGGVDSLHKRLLSSTIRSDKLNDDLRVAGMGLYHAEDNPNGWLLLGTFPRQGDNFFPPETPWFFNQSGTAAVCMRREAFSFNNGGADVIEDKLHRLTCTVSGGNSAVFGNAGNLPPYEHKEIHKQEMIRIFVEDPHPPALQHSWEHYQTQAGMVISGEQNVFSDFLEDEEWTAKVKYYGWRNHTHFISKGIDDPANFPDNETSCNTDYWTNTYSSLVRSSPKTFSSFVYVPDPVPIEYGEDSRPSPWFGSSGNVIMYIGPPSSPEYSSIALYQQESGTSTEFDGHPKQADDPWFYYYKFTTNTMRGAMDIRNVLLLVSENYTYSTRNGNGMIRVEQNKSVLYTPDNTGEGDTLKNITKPPVNGYFNFGWPLELMLGWGSDAFDETLTRTTYKGLWATDNREGELQVPGSLNFYADTLGDLSKGWPLLPDMLYGAVSSACRGNGVLTEFGAWAIDVEVPTVEGGDSYVVVSKTSWGGALPAYTKFSPPAYPLGTC